MLAFVMILQTIVLIGLIGHNHYHLKNLEDDLARILPHERIDSED